MTAGPDKVRWMGTPESWANVVALYAVRRGYGGGAPRRSLADEI